MALPLNETETVHPSIYCQCEQSFCLFVACEQRKELRSCIRVGLVSEMKEDEIEMYVAGTEAMRTAGLEGTRPFGRIVLK